jgi:hypothetical protein
MMPLLLGLPTKYAPQILKELHTQQLTPGQLCLLFFICPV